jgi:hypothetical protein
MLCPAQMLGKLSPSAKHPHSLEPCGVRRLAAAVCRPGSPGRAPRISTFLVGAQQEGPPGRWNDRAPEASARGAREIIEPGGSVVPGADAWQAFAIRQASAEPRTVWSAAACRRCLPSRLARTCSPHLHFLRKGTARCARRGCLATRSPSTTRAEFAHGLRSYTQPRGLQRGTYPRQFKWGIK